MSASTSTPTPTPSASSPPTPAVTRATASTEEEMREAMAHFLHIDTNTLVFTQATGGVNNKCYFVMTPSGTEYLLRIYNNGGNTARVQYEHAVLMKMRDKKFSFQLPTPLPVITNDPAAVVGTSGTFALLKSGACACLFPRIPGSGADASSLQHAHAIGEATAELVRGMKDVTIDLPLPNPLYRNMYDAHHAITHDSFYQLIRGPQCDHVRAAASELLHELDLIEALIDKILKFDPPLPQQQIHADLHFSNVLVRDGRVSGVLDFEFCAPDWTAMELVVGLSKYIATPGCEELFESWVKGYGAGGGELTSVEADLVPELIILRVLNNVIYFAGRWLAGEDEPAALTSRMDMYAARCRWIREKMAWMKKLLHATLVQQTA